MLINDQVGCLVANDIRYGYMGVPQPATIKKSPDLGISGL